MTNVVPEPFVTAMRCPSCQHEAGFYVPYQMLFLTLEELERFEKVLKGYHRHLMLEVLPARQVLWYFPDLFAGPWQGWEGKHGVGVCHSCGWRSKYTWHGDEDYFYSVTHRGQTLRLQKRQHVIVVRDFLASKDRNYRAYPSEFWHLLSHLPEEFIRAKARPTLLKKIAALLALINKMY